MEEVRKLLKELEHDMGSHAITGNSLGDLDKWIGIVKSALRLVE